MNDDVLRLDRQMCFSIYVLHREIMQRYRPLLDDVDLTYPQYITLMALWEQDNVTVSQLGKVLQLDNGTLTPLLKRLEAKGLLTRDRSKEDERVVNISLTDEGIQLKEKVSCIPLQIFNSMNLSSEDVEQLKNLSDKVINKLKY